MVGTSVTTGNQPLKIASKHPLHGTVQFKHSFVDILSLTPGTVCSEVPQGHEAVDEALQDTDGIKLNLDKKALSSLKVSVKLIYLI